MEWDTIKNGSYDKRYPRTAEDESEYQWHKLVTQEMAGGIEQYIQAMYIDRLEPYVLTPNRFRYNLAPEIRHYLLWFDKKFKITQDLAERIITQRFPGCEFICWINPVQHRSILTVPHYQVFVRCGDVAP